MRVSVVYWLTMVLISAFRPTPSPCLSKARQGFPLCDARTFPNTPPNPVRGSLSAAVGDAAAPTTP